MVGVSAVADTFSPATLWTVTVSEIVCCFSGVSIVHLHSQSPNKSLLRLNLPKAKDLSSSEKVLMIAPAIAPANPITATVTSVVMPEQKVKAHRSDSPHTWRLCTQGVIMRRIYRQIQRISHVIRVAPTP